MRYILIIAAILFCNAMQAQSLLPDYSKDAFHDSATISLSRGTGNMHYDGGREEFLMYDVWLDGYITDNMPFSITYDCGKVLVNDKALPEDVCERYARKVNAMFDKRATPLQMYKRKFTLFSKAYHFKPVKGTEPGTENKYCYTTSFAISKDY
ncbi:MAG: hypothetical protein JST82_01390 [Bacteroidetes bacterium]|nr:hypothetical protein [Bacteroidota bacterium]